VGRLRFLTVDRAEGALWSWAQGLPRPLLDLSGLERFDAFGLCLLALLGWKAKEEGGFPRFFLPEEREVAEELSRTGFFRLLSGAFWADKALPEANGNGRFLLVRVEREEGIGNLVEAFAGMLESRFPFGERTNRILVGAVLELLQNIPHHAAAGREDLAPVGFAALEEAEDHLHLAVVDGGVGLRGSLSLNPRYRGVSTAEALELILVEGASRFEEPGRGGSLKRIREVALRNSGKFYVRSLDGVFFQEDVEWRVGSSFLFPGVQISIRLPKRLFLDGAPGEG